MSFPSPSSFTRSRRDGDHMVVGFTTTYAISAYHHRSCEFDSRSGNLCSIQHYVIQFFCDFRQVSAFLQAIRFPPPIKPTATK